MTSSTEIDHSDHPPAIVSSESVARQERGDPYSSETSELNKPTKTPKLHKNENHEREREDPYYSEIPEWLQELRENLVDDRVPERRDSHASSSHEPSSEPTFARSADWVNTVFALTSLKRPKLRDLSEDQNYKSPVQKTYWRSRTSCRKFW